MFTCHDDHVPAKSAALPPQRRRWSSPPELLVRIILVVLGALLILAVTIMGLNVIVRQEPFWLVVPHRTPAGTDATGVDVLELIKVSLTMVAGLGGVVALTVAYRKQALAERDEQRTQEASFRDRYGAAAAQLGHDDPAVRLAGVYALANLADDWHAQRQQCVDVLCAYLRLPWNPHHNPTNPMISRVVERPGAEGEGPKEKTTTTYGYPDQSGEVEVRKTILRVLADHLKGPHSEGTDSSPRPPGSWSDVDLDLTGATLPPFEWQQVTTKAHFDKVIFTGDVWFSGATFTGGASFGSATFFGNARFDRVNVTGNTWFGDATFNLFASFDETIFDGNADFIWSTFTEPSSFRKATFNGDADFEHVTFTQSTRFHKTTFTKTALFEEVTFSSTAGFEQATFTGNAGFRKATFHGNAGYDGATFNGDAGYDGATFNRGATFDGVTFKKPTRLDGATFNGHRSFVEATGVLPPEILEDLA